MAGHAKRQIKDNTTGKVYESMYQAGKEIAPAFIAEQVAKGAKGAEKLKNDQHIWFAIARAKENVGRFMVSDDGGATWETFVFKPSVRKSAAERKAAAEAKAAANGGGTASTAPAGETKEQRIARLKAELAATETETATEAVAEPTEETAQPTPGKPKLAGAMRVAKG